MLLLKQSTAISNPTNFLHRLISLSTETRHSLRSFLLLPFAPSTANHFLILFIREQFVATAILSGLAGLPPRFDRVAVSTNFDYPSVFSLRLHCNRKQRFRLRLRLHLSKHRNLRYMELRGFISPRIGKLTRLQTPKPYPSYFTLLLPSINGKQVVGKVIANDVDVQRCKLLIHQTKRMCTSNLAVTNHEAQYFPSCRWKKNNTTNGSDLGGMSMTELLFDRVLCDVPCSGDGTLRKAPDIWKKWSMGMANGVHCLQLQIAMRAWPQVSPLSQPQQPH
ncbi:unnamed protein product [Lactuca saligna]|uniref:SAM-dependent MTase RsmB/NOP-type domain-containing protein n=1 Tax=Lactuca saligna TaxID=75948 RepID=A0AA36EGP6_LACSI|nr:unnamed protein product [Lactuca saligna]